MDLNELDEAVNQNEKHNEVSNADMLASIVIIQGELRKIEKLIADNQKISQKSLNDIKDNLVNNDKNISAIPVLTANIITEKLNNVVTDINNGNVNIATLTKALNESNAAFEIYLKCWIISMVIAFVLILLLVFWR